MKKPGVLLGLLVSCPLGGGMPVARADAFYCGPNTIRDGMSAAEIETKCGPPDRVEVVTEPVYSRLESGAVIRVGDDVSELWYYDRGPNQFVAQITVRDGLAHEVELLRVRDLRDLD